MAKIWTNKPPSGSQINWSNPLSDRLEGCWLMNERSGAIVRDHTGKNSGYMSNFSTITWRDTYLNFTENQYGCVICKPSGNILSGKDKFTIMSLARTSAARGSGSGQIGTGGNSIYCERAASGNDILKQTMIDNSTNTQLEFTFRNDAGTLLQLRSNTAVLNDGKWHQFVCLKNSGVHYIYIDGKYDNKGNYGGNNTFTNSNVCRISGDSADSASSWVGDISYVFLWSRALTSNEIRSLSQNPYQFISRPSYRSYNIIEAGTTTYKRRTLVGVGI